RERRGAGRRLAPAEDLGPMPVQRGEVGPRATPSVLVFDVHAAPRGGRERGMNPEPRLGTGLLVGRQNVLPRAQRDAGPAPGVETEDARGLGGKRRSTRVGPVAMPLRT